MQAAARIVCGLSCLAAWGACSRGALQRGADGGDAPGAVVFDGGSASDWRPPSDQLFPPDAAPDTALDGPALDGPALDAPALDAPTLDAPTPDVSLPPINGRRSFVVTSAIFAQSDGGVIFPRVHTFTMILDWDRGTAILGDGNGGGSAPFRAAARGGTITPMRSFSTGGGWSVTHDTIEVAIDPAGALSGTGSGRAVYVPPNSDVGSSSPAAISLTGVPDTQPPGFSANVGSTPSDPLGFLLTLSPTEPLPSSIVVTVVGDRGDRVYLAAQDTQPAAFAFNPVPRRMWRYDEQYTILLSGILDFAGNASPAGSELSFRTSAAPPLASEDGFESTTGSTFAGGQVLAGADAPTISGARSLYVPPLAQALPPGRSELKQLGLRLPLDATDTVVRFEYRLVDPNPARSGQTDPIFGIGSEGGLISYADLPAYDGPTTRVTIPGHGEVALGPVTTASLPLPSDTAATASELTLIRKVPACCSGLPAPPVPGIIIDDLRVE